MHLFYRSFACFNFIHLRVRSEYLLPYFFAEYVTCRCGSVPCIQNVRTPLMHAITHDHTDCARMLLEIGAETQTKDQVRGCANLIFHLGSMRGTQRLMFWYLTRELF